MPTLWIHHHPLQSRIHDEVHVIQGDGTEQYAIAMYEGTREAGPIAKRHLHRPDIGHERAPAVGGGHLAAFQLREFQLQGDMLWHAEIDRARIHQRRDRQWG